jgi:uncharacterized protein (DUF3084 family)
MNTIHSAEKVTAEKVSKEKDAIIRKKDAALQEKEAVIQEKDTALQEKDTALQEKDTIINTFVEDLYKREVPPEQIAEITKTPIDKIHEIIRLSQHENSLPPG